MGRERRPTDDDATLGSFGRSVSAITSRRPAPEFELATNESTVLRADSEHPTPPPPASPNVTIDVSRLILGREIRFPLHDRSGLLLLREGSVITSEFKRKLEARQIAAVCVHQDDAGLIAFDLPSELRSESPGTAPHCTAEATRKLETALAEGLPFVTNQGPAVRRSMVWHGVAGYDAARGEAIAEHSRETATVVDTLMANALAGSEVDGQSLCDASARCLGHLTADMDQTLGATLDLGRERQIAQHSLQMSMLGMAMGVELGLNADNVGRIGVTALVHDWGMLRIPREIREADRRLSEAEMIEIRKHPIYAIEILERISRLPSLVSFVSYQVHEKLDGSGYPRGRVERNIHLFARILHVADIYCALTTPRPWRAAYTPYAAMRSLLTGDNAHGCDPLVLRALLRVKSLFPVGSYVTLSDSSVAQVMRANGDKYTQPIVRLVQDARGRTVPDTSNAALLDLADSPLCVAEALPTPGRHELTVAPSFVRAHNVETSAAHTGVKAPHVPLGMPQQKLQSSGATPRPHIRPNRSAATRRNVLRRP